jgi:hypothetical protein
MNCVIHISPFDGEGCLSHTVVSLKPLNLSAFPSMLAVFARAKKGNWQSVGGGDDREAGGGDVECAGWPCAGMQSGHREVSSCDGHRAPSRQEA